MRSLNMTSVLEMIRGLPALPETHVQVMQLSSDPTSSVAEIARVINTDAALAARVLKVANTPFYGMNGRIETVSRAVVILGSRTVYSLVLGAGIVEVLNSEDPRTECGIDVWQHCLQTAIAARTLAEHNGTLDADFAFTGGLLHDMGKLVLASMFPEGYRSVLEEHSATSVPLQLLEQQLFGIDHARAGGVLCRTWNLPQTLRVIVENHHCDDSVQSVASAVANGNVLARLVAPRASGEVFVSAAELARLFSRQNRAELLRRLVVSQSMQPPVLNENSQRCDSVVIDVSDPDVREAVRLVALACGHTPLNRDDAADADLVISETGTLDEARPASELRHISLSTCLSDAGGVTALNIAALHRAFLFTTGPALRPAATPVADPARPASGKLQHNTGCDNGYHNGFDEHISGVSPILKTVPAER
ncbi:MAG: HDOD domain-containing protein [Planctomycetaceae bacterium]